MLVPVTDPFTSLEDGIRGLLTSQLDLFVQMGHNLFRGFATILIVWFGVQAALSSAEGARDSASPASAACSWSSPSALQW